MGYTHYIRRMPKLDRDIWKNFANDVKKILNNSDVPLTYIKKDNDVNGFEVTNNLINFNGKGDDAHETFYLKRSRKREEFDDSNSSLVFDFCKTAEKPYDKYVVACLILAQCYFDDNVKISSDGDWAEWQEGKSIVENILGYSIVINGEELHTIRFKEMEKISETEKKLIFGN